MPNIDGEMYLRVKPANPADVNGHGVVNILDLTIVAPSLGTDSLKGDVNGDGLLMCWIWCLWRTNSEFGISIAQDFLSPPLPTQSIAFWNQRMKTE